MNVYSANTTSAPCPQATRTLPSECKTAPSRPPTAMQLASAGAWFSRNFLNRGAIIAGVITQLECITDCAAPCPIPFAVGSQQYRQGAKRHAAVFSGRDDCGRHFAATGCAFFPDSGSHRPALPDRSHRHQFAARSAAAGLARSARHLPHPLASRRYRYAQTGCDDRSRCADQRPALERCHPRSTPTGQFARSHRVFFCLGAAAGTAAR
ncbi:hypothetical protein WG78_19085 [Amantichitinum ursilacus]|uniref:Uncharacterized protein n=1 Tax=Amantichitinum ursilacus TaxID=857265 RepID=A0A0N0XG94_9NEIS|nr:hypothetical protein WG78_19085 [Amantichitinum ursilacus]